MNGATIAQYTPLESLLFFQALRAQSLNSINFGQISGELHSIPLVRNDATFNNERLNPDALQNLYLSLVKEEAKRDVERAYQEEEGGSSGTAPSGSRKRKAPSPSVPTVEEAAKHSHLLPGLLHRLYGAFRQKVVAEIREDERAFDVVNREIEELEQGDWDERLQAQQQPGGVTNGNGMPTEVASTIPSEQGDAAAGKIQPTRSEAEERPRSARASIDALVNHDSDAGSSATVSRQRNATSTITTLPPLSEMAPERVVQDQSPNLSRGISHHGQSPRLPQPPLPPGSTYQGSPSVGHQSPYLQQYAPQAMSHGASPSAKLAHQSPSSPRRMLPLPPGMKMPAQSPSIQNGTGPYRAQPQMQPPQYPSPSQRAPQPVAMSPIARQNAPIPGPHMQTPQGYHQQQHVQYAGQQQPYTPQQQQPGYPVRPSQQGGFQLAPFQVANQDSTRIQQYGGPQQGRAQHPQSAPQPGRPVHYGQYSPYPQPLQPQFQSGMKPSQVAQRLVGGLARSRRPTWKSTHSPLPERPKTPESPMVEPMSPVRRRATLPPKPIAEKEPSKRGPGRPPRQSAQHEHALEPPPKPEVAAKKPTRRTRGNSVASSAIASSTRGRTRSQSVVSQADVPAPVDRPIAGRRVKNEPSTPAALLPDEEVVHEGASTAGRTTRNRRGTLQSQIHVSGRSNPKTSVELPDEESADSDMAQNYDPGRKDVVFAARNFGRTSAYIIDAITAHKHANRFKQGVKDSEAAGYHDIVKRPQNITSIKAAIKAGTRAVTAAATAAIEDGTTDSPAGTPAKDSGMLVFDKTAELIPPKAIVNGSQLEKEVMRMFANAVMFNAGEGAAGSSDVVAEARQMAEDVEASMRDWRGVETKTKEDDGETAGTAKRRKL